MNKIMLNTIGTPCKAGGGGNSGGGGEESAFPIFKYLTFEALEDEFSVSFTINELMYCINGNGKWKILSVGGKTEAINKGDYISFKATPSNLSSGVGTFSTTGQFNAMGNALSLLYGDNAEENIGTTLPSYAFNSLFSVSKIVNVSPTLFPSTSISSYSYKRVFFNCRKLTKAPTFCNTNVPNNCFNEAFAWCTSLIDVYPFDQKGWTSLGEGAFYKMFSNCTSLKSAGFAIPDSTQARVCMSYMFENCTNLEIAPIIGDIKGFPTNIFSIFSGCSKLKYIKCMSTYAKPYIDFGTLPEKGVLVKSASNTWIADKVPSGWTIVDEE
jgi:hypothetical protein